MLLGSLAWTRVVVVLGTVIDRAGPFLNHKRYNFWPMYNNRLCFCSTK